MIRRALSLLALLLALEGAAFAQTDMTGYWKFSVPNGGTIFMELKQTGETVSSGGRRPSTGTIHGNHFRIENGGTGNGSTVFEATVSGNKFPATRTSQGTWGNVEKGTMERVSHEEMSPARLPLPDLRDIPDNGLVRTPPMGWNSWNKYHDHIDDATVRATADAMVASGMNKVGYTYVIVDEGWSSSRDKEGKITGNARFPDMKALAAYVHSKGLKIGIYSSPGPQVCGGYQGSYGHEQEDAQTFADWGYDYLKYDWCSAGGIYQTPDLQGVYQKMGEALQKTGRPIVFSLCEYGSGDVWTWGAKTGGNLWRTTFDISDNWQSMERIGFAQLDIAANAQPGHWNDPDMLEVGNGGMTADEYRTHMSLWSMLRAPLIAGNDLRSMTEETKSILMNPDIIAIDQDADAKPVHVQSAEGKTEVLVRPLSGNAVAVGLFNRGDTPAQMSFRWDSLHLDAGLGQHFLEATDLWKHQTIDVTGDTYTATVPPHGVVVVRASTPGRRR
ncbi:MAG: glycoside hydrolase family 27 protein [Granulicella sp.]